MTRTIDQLLNAKPFIAVHQGGPAVLVSHGEAMMLLEAGAELIDWDQHSSPDREVYRFEWYCYEGVRFLWLEHFFPGLQDNRVLADYPGTRVHPPRHQVPT